MNVFADKMFILNVCTARNGIIRHVDVPADSRKFVIMDLYMMKLAVNVSVIGKTAHLISFLIRILARVSVT